MTDNLLPISPIRVGHLAHTNGSTAPMYLMGYNMGEPVYRTTFAMASGKQVSTGRSLQ